MKRLAELQDAFQRAILAGDDAVLSQIGRGPGASREALLGVYRDAYLLRLLPALAHRYPRLAETLGASAFEDLVRSYASTGPSRGPDIREAGRALPAYLASTHPYRDRPALAELAQIEAAVAADEAR